MNKDAVKGRYKWGDEYTEEEIARATVHKDDERHIVDITKLPFKIPTLWGEAEDEGLAIWNQLYDEFGGKEHVVSVIKQDPERKSEETQDIWNRFDELFFFKRRKKK